jgi:hypothetical protein
MSCLQPAYGMTEICVAFYGQPGDTLEQENATVGSVDRNIKVSAYVCKCVCVEWL